MRKKNHFSNSQVLLVTLFVVIFAGIVIYPGVFGLEAQTGRDLIGLVPGFILITVGVYVYDDSQGVLRSGAYVMFSIGIAVFIGTAYDLNLVSADMLNGLTLGRLQTWLVAIGVILGAVDFVL